MHEERELVNPSDIASNINQQMHRFFLFASIASHSRKTEDTPVLVDHEGNTLPYDTLIVMAFSFFYHYYKADADTSVKGLAKFFSLAFPQFHASSCHEEDDVFLLAAKFIVEHVMLFENRLGPTYEYFTPFGKEMGFHNETIYRYLNDIDGTDNYELSKDGFELAVALQDIFNIKKVTMEALMLKMEVEKQNYTGAMKALYNMKKRFAHMKEEISSLTSGIRKNILENQTIEKYNEMIHKNHKERENEGKILQEVHKRLDDSKHNPNLSISGEKWKEILHTSDLLNQNIKEHTEILAMSLDLVNLFQKISLQSIANPRISSSFLFRKDILYQVFNANFPLEALQILIVPFCLGIPKAKENDHFSFAWKQSIKNTAKDEPIPLKNDLNPVIHKPHIKEVADQCFELLDSFFREKTPQYYYQHSHECSLEEFIPYLQQKNPEFLDDKYAHIFFLKLYSEGLICKDTCHPEDWYAGFLEYFFQLEISRGNKKIMFSCRSGDVAISDLKIHIWPLGME